MAKLKKSGVGQGDLVDLLNDLVDYVNLISTKVPGLKPLSMDPTKVDPSKEKFKITSHLDKQLRKDADDVFGLECRIARNQTKINNNLSKSYSYGSIAAGSAAEKSVFTAPDKCVVRNLYLTNGAALAIDASNNTKLELINKKADGTGATVLATFDQTTEAFVAFDVVVKSLSDVVLNKEDVLSLKKSETGTGGAVTDLLVEINYKPF